MNKIFYDSKLLLTLYGSLLIIIGLFFLILDEQVLEETYRRLPLLFMIRFSIFWFMCLVVAVAGYLYYLSYTHINLPNPDKLYAARLGRLALYIGVAGCSMAFICFLTLRHYPFA